MRDLIKKNRRQFAVGILFLLAYTPTFIMMWERWFARDSYYSHGVLVPFVSAFLIWQMREELGKIVPKESPWGLPLIILGVLLLWVSSLFRVFFAAAFSLMFVLSGLILYFYGSETMKRIFFPFAFLFFMLPLPLVVIVNISFKMKILAAQISTELLNHIRIPAIREGSLIRMRHASVMVEDVCSGLRSLISLAALGSIFAYWMKAPMIKRLLLFALTIPIAVITNVIRVIFLAFVSEVWGSQYASGLVHDLSGFIVFAFAFILLYAAGKLLE